MYFQSNVNIFINVYMFNNFFFLVFTVATGMVQPKSERCYICGCQSKTGCVDKSVDQASKF